MPSYVQLTDRIRRLPLASRVPTVRKVTAANLTMLERIVSAQKEYAQSVLGTPSASPAPAAPKATAKPRATRKTS